MTCAAATPREAWMADQDAVALADALGRIAAEPVIPYPPGVATIVPGERLDAAAIDELARMAAMPGIRLTGCADARLRTIRVMVEQQEGEDPCATPS